MNGPEILAVALGGAVGAVLRSSLARYLNRRYPAGTLLANFFGCLLLGSVLGHGPVDTLYTFALTAGLCGALTTFSSWILELALMIKSRQYNHAALYALITPALALAGVEIGLLL